MIKDEELAWAAGFFDGEGTIYSAIRTKCKYPQRVFVVAVSQAGDFAEDMLSRFMDAVVGVGNIYCSGQRNCKHSVGYNWRVANFSDCMFVLEVLWPWLSERKKAQAIKCIERYKSWSGVGMSSDRGRKMADKRWNNA